MPNYSQKDRIMAISTSLGEDALLLYQFSGTETMSELFTYELEVFSEGETGIEFESLIGQPITVSMQASAGTRYYHGICNRISDLGAVWNQFQDTMLFRKYQLTIVPLLWLLTKQTNSRIFQHITIPDILKKVLGEHRIDFKDNMKGKYDPRDYVAQYRESDFAFLSRLMEEEGIHYHFEHTDGKHTMILGDSAVYDSITKPFAGRSDGDKLIFDRNLGGTREENRIQSWVKSQEIRSGKVVHYDHTFEMPHRNHESVQSIQPTVSVGRKTHKLTAGSKSLELFDYPGGYAQRYDGIDRAGGETPDNLAKIAPDGKRTVSIRQEQEAVGAIGINASSNCREIIPGFTFRLDEHGEGDGEYLITTVQHYASLEAAYLGEARSDDIGGYRNSFSVMPKGLPFRPQRRTPKPMMMGTQTGLVVGPSGSEIFTDKHSRVKVHFHWDRQSKSNADSSCWVRVATLWAGTNWGMIHIPRIGQEVVVAFEEGDPDRPIIVGSVYNARETPPYKLPDNMTQFGFKSRSSPGGSTDNYNELRFEDKKGQEHVYLHAEKDFTRVVENNDIEVVGYSKLDESNIKTSKVSSKDQAWEVYNNRFEQIGVSSGAGSLTTIIQKDLNTTLKTGDETHKIEKGSRIVEIYKDDKLTIKTGDQTEEIKQGSRSVTIMKDDKLKLKTGSRTVEIMKNDKLKLKSGSRTVEIMKNDKLTIKTGNQTTKVKLGAAKTTALQSITLQVGLSKIVLDQLGVKIEGLKVTVGGKIQTTIKGLLVDVKGSAMTKVKGGLVKIN